MSLIVISLTGDLGGYLGLLIGGSLITVIEILDFMIKEIVA